MATPNQGRIPVRTCVGCRQQDPQNKLIRVILVAGKLKLDSTNTATGRGAYLHQNPDCLSLAINRKLFNRAFKVSGQIDSSELLSGDN